MERPVLDVEVQKPLEQQVVAQLLSELALRANLVEGHQETRLEQVLERDRGSPRARKDPIEERGHAPQRLVGQGFDPLQRVVRRDEGIRRQPQHHRRLPLTLTAHCRPLSSIGSTPPP